MLYRVFCRRLPSLQRVLWQVVTTYHPRQKCVQVADVSIPRSSRKLSKLGDVVNASLHLRDGDIFCYMHVRGIKKLLDPTDQLRGLFCVAAPVLASRSLRLQMLPKRLLTFQASGADKSDSHQLM